MDHDLVALRLPPGPALLAAVDRIWSAGDAALLLPWQASDAAVREILDALKPAALAQPGPDDDGEDVRIRRLPGARPVGQGTALVVPTSGSTGRPKGVELTHAALNASAHASIKRLECSRGEAWLCCLPLHHVAGLMTVLRSRRLDAKPVIHPGFDVAAVAAETRATHVSLVPTQLHRLLEADADVSRWTTILLGGAAPPPGLLRRAADAGANVVLSYGATETSGGCVYDGRPLDGVEIRLDEGSRIMIRGKVLMRGYRLEPALTGKALRDGWFRTGDLGRFDDDGRLEVLGRADDVIITGGENVVASRVARVLAADDRVADVAVVGRPDPEWGQVVTAVVQPADPDAPPSLDDLRTTAADHLPGYAWPKELWLVESLPRDAMGKISRQAVERFVAERGA